MSMNKHTINLVTNVVLFQATWFSLVMGPLWLAVIPLTMLLIHAGICSDNAKREIAFAFCVMCFGVICDSIMMTFNIYSLQPLSVFDQSLLPSWLILLWVAFSMSLKHSLNWLFSMPKVMLIILTIVGPASYYAGAQLNPQRIVIELDLIYWVMIQWAVLSLIILGLHEAFYNRALEKEVGVQ